MFLSGIANGIGSFAPMEQRSIRGVPVSAVGLGCWTFGRTVDRATSIDIVHAALDAGVTFFDVADGYGKGRAEEYLGQALAGRRDDVFLATKVGAGRGSGHRTALGFRQNAGGADPAYIRTTLETSLRRLGTEHLDLLQLHDPDPETDLVATLGALEQLVTAGKVRLIGCSNYTPEQLYSAESVARQRGLVSFATVQNQYSLLHQAPRDELLPACAELDVGLLPYFPLANGVLTGKYKGRAEPPDDSRISVFLGEGRKDKAARFLNDRNLARTEALTTFAELRGRTLLELAFGWLLSQPVVRSVIAGASRPQQVLDNAAASDWRLTTEELAEVDRLLSDGEPLICAEPS